MWEEIHLEFVPTENRYYYDCIRVVAAGCEPLTVPIHGYPVVNTAEFPTAVDFGNCSITETMQKVVPLKCHVPIEFEFELKIAKPHPFFEISPTHGVIPANGQVDITINFHPLRYTSARMEMEVNISQFGFEPFMVNLTGCGLPETSSSEPLAPTVVIKDPNQTKKKIEKVTIKCKRPVVPPGAPHIMLEGILMPPTLDTPYHCNDVLMAQPGKLKIKDLKAVLKQRSGEGEVTGRQMLEAQFLKDNLEEQEKERNKEIRPALPECAVQTTGDRPTTEEEIKAIAEGR